MTNVATTSVEIGCIDAASDVLGDKWTPRLLRVLHNTDQARFCQIQDEVGGINPRTLSARLQELETKAIITKTPTESETRCLYSLTKKGRDLIPIIESMHDWSSRYA